MGTIFFQADLTALESKGSPTPLGYRLRNAIAKILFVRRHSSTGNSENDGAGAWPCILIYVSLYVLERLHSAPLTPYVPRADSGSSSL